MDGVIAAGSIDSEMVSMPGIESNFVSDPVVGTRCYHPHNIGCHHLDTRQTMHSMVDESALFIYLSLLIVCDSCTLTNIWM